VGCEDWKTDTNPSRGDLYTSSGLFSQRYGSILVAGDTEGTLLLGETATWRLSLWVKVQRLDADTQEVDSIVFSLDGTRLAHASQTSVVKLCSLNH
jgi:hypothetical protein